MNYPESGRYMIETRHAMRARIQLSSPDGEVHLRQYIPSDATAAFKLIQRNKAHLSQFDDETGSKYKSVDEFRKSITHPSDPNRLRFGIWNNENTLVGSINLTETGPELASIGYYLDKDHVGNGYTQRAVKTLTDFAFKQFGYKDVQAAVHQDNVASVKVLHGAGYQFDFQPSDEWIIFLHSKPQA